MSWGEMFTTSRIDRGLENESRSETRLGSIVAASQNTYVVSFDFAAEPTRLHTTVCLFFSAHQRLKSHPSRKIDQPTNGSPVVPETEEEKLCRAT